MRGWSWRWVAQAMGWVTGERGVEVGGPDTRPGVLRGPCLSYAPADCLSVRSGQGLGPCLARAEHRGAHPGKGCVNPDASFVRMRRSPQRASRPCAGMPWMCADSSSRPSPLQQAAARAPAGQPASYPQPTTLMPCTTSPSLR